MKLSEKLDNIRHQKGEAFFQNMVPAIITSSLKSQPRPYQMEALGRFIYHMENNTDRTRPTQLLMQMATGSGKTLIMAGLLPYLHSLGYSCFLFFVNSTNIIEKTRDNFLNPNSVKYLFAEPDVTIDGRKVRIREVDSFQNASPSDINICFCTVQGLHSQLNTPRENAISYDDFQSRSIVMIADEAHHISASTKSRKTSTDGDTATWETTVDSLLSANPGNIMLEFTATANLGNSALMQKYQDKILFDYPLRQFRAAGYSKDVQTMQLGGNSFQRTLAALMLSQYRKTLFSERGISIKPVVMLKSKTIKESRDFQQEFSRRLSVLGVEDFETTINLSGQGPLVDMRSHLERKGISMQQFCHAIKEQFAEPYQLSVNSSEESDSLQLSVNTLESPGNPYRLIFAVDKLNEGWDVLNLFDIVRLYGTQKASSRTTVQEAQLIGRGARYCPFRLNPADNPYIRKMDTDPANPMRICEQLIYHSPADPAYIRELHTALENIGICPPSGTQDEPTYRNAINTSRRIYIRPGYTLGTSQAHTITTTASGLGHAVVRKAMRCCPEMQFSNLRQNFPGLKSVSEFISSPEYLGGAQLTLHTDAQSIDTITPQERLCMAHNLIHKLLE